MKIGPAFAAILLMGQGLPALAQAAPPSAGDVDRDAVAALQRMAAALRELKNYSLSAEVTREEVLTTGQKLQYAGTMEVKVRRPDGLRLDVSSDRQARNLYFDGKTLTVFAPHVGYYASVKAPGTIAEMLKLAQDNYDIEFPLADLFEWSGKEDPAANITSAFRVGTEHIGGVACEHYAVRGTSADWQVWIAPAPSSLPCKLVITTTDDPSMPQYSAVLRWSPGAPFEPAQFTFTPPTGAREIQLARASQ